MCKNCVTASRNEYSLLPEEECYNVGDVMDITCMAMWHSSQVRVTLKNIKENTTATADGILTGNDSCTHQAAISMEKTFEFIGEIAEFECDIEFKNETEVTLHTTGKACSGLCLEFMSAK